MKLFMELGEKEKAFAALEDAFENREYQLRFIKLDPASTHCAAIPGSRNWPTA